MTSDSGLRLVDFLDHIEEASRLAREYVTEMSKESFLKDREDQSTRRDAKRQAASVIKHVLGTEAVLARRPKKLSKPNDTHNICAPLKPRLSEGRKLKQQPGVNVHAILILINLR